MKFIADLHIHSKYSRATSRNLDLEHLHRFAQLKGLTVAATGDFTHPAWFAELKAKLVPAEQGLLRLKDDLAKPLDEAMYQSCAGPVRFILSVEISSIYKRGDKTRKVHNVVYMPDFEAAEKFRTRLARIGNIESDGRPILGLDSRDLLEITLESGPDSFLIPAHIWTPWFSVLGSKSGFEALEECYADLSHEIFALETGLSSDPPMNWRLSALDRYRLVSNSDAHSPEKLGREANLFDTDLSYPALRRALQTGRGYLGTIEFYPEEGKYHLDGHRKCNQRFEPEETIRLAEICPVCGGKITVGVMHRVEVLADRKKPVKPKTAGEFFSLIPLPEILGEVHHTGPQSKKVDAEYYKLLAELGPELFILRDAALPDVEAAGSSMLAEALRRMRAGDVHRDAGYDGEYGVIRLFTDAERDSFYGQGILFSRERKKAEQKKSEAIKKEERKRGSKESDEKISPLFSQSEKADSGIIAGLNREQADAVTHGRGPLMIVAGPGTGKTRTLTHRIAGLIKEQGVPAQSCLAVTFTNKAAQEMKSRLNELLGENAAKTITIKTFHGLGLMILAEQIHLTGRGPGFVILDEQRQRLLLMETASLKIRPAKSLKEKISQARQELLSPEEVSDPEVSAAYKNYEAALKKNNAFDFDDLIVLPVKILRDNAELLKKYRERFRFVFVDEYQDVARGQYELLRLLCPPGSDLCVIGDPDQAIYGFRGSDVRFFRSFTEDYPAARVVRLTQNYRSSGTILAASTQVIGRHPDREASSLHALLQSGPRLRLNVAGSDKAEAEYVVHSIERIMGGISYFSLDSGRAGDEEPLHSQGFSDFAVLYRTDEQSGPLIEALHRSGIPYQKTSAGRLMESPGVSSVVELMQESAQSNPGRPVREYLDLAAARLAPGENDRALKILSQQALDSVLGLDDFLSELALQSEMDLFDPRAERVSLMTLHAAKGLEWGVVFIVGCEDGLIPFHFGPARKDQAGERELNEERRLLYVGMTRARHLLIMTHAKKRLRRGKISPCTPSPFLDDIAAALKDLEKSRAGKPAKKSPQPKLF